MNVRTWVSVFCLGLSLLCAATTAGQRDNAVTVYDSEDYTSIFNALRPLAEQGYIFAQLNIGTMYANGQGVQQDYAEAQKWYQLAAEKGNADALYHLGTMYERGYGVPQDNVKAHMWFSLAVEHGNEDAYTENRDNIAKQMSSEQIAEAQKLAREWLAVHLKK